MNAVNDVAIEYNLFVMGTLHGNSNAFTKKEKELFRKIILSNHKSIKITVMSKHFKELTQIYLNKFILKEKIHETFH